MRDTVRISLCGFGGQGIILSAVVIGAAAVIHAGKYAVQTQSYGSEARGGQCQAELIVSCDPIQSPIAPRKDILLCMFQTAYDRYIDTLENDGVLIIDSDLVQTLSREVKRTFSVPATAMAVSLGNKMAANMVMLGFLAECTGILKVGDLKSAVEEQVSARFLELDLKAVDAGVAFAKENGLYVTEV